jgi:hypothetical protein
LVVKLSLGKIRGVPFIPPAKMEDNSIYGEENEEPKPRGRPKKYTTKAEAKAAQAAQKKEFAKRQRKELHDKRQLMSPQQLELIEFLTKNVIANIPLLELIRKRLGSHRLALLRERLDLREPEELQETSGWVVQW